MGRHFSGGLGMRYALAFLARWVLIASAQASPCFVTDPVEMICVRRRILLDRLLSPNIIYVDDPVVLMGSNGGVPPFTNFFFFFQGLLTLKTQRSRDFGVVYDFNGYFTSAG